MTTFRRCICTSTRDSGLTVRGLVGSLDLSRLAATPAQRQVFPHEGVHPQQVVELAARMSTMRLNPAPILLVHRGPAAVREVNRQVRSGAPDREYVDHAGQQHRVWAIRDPDQLRTIGVALERARGSWSPTDTTATRPRSRCTAATRRPPTATGLAMIIDQDDTPLFLGAIHRVLHGVRIEDLVSRRRRAARR